MIILIEPADKLMEKIVSHKLARIFSVGRSGFRRAAASSKLAAALMCARMI